MSDRLDSLDSLVREATRCGFTSQEIDVVKRYYFDALIKYDDAHKDKRPVGIRACINYEEVRQMTAYAVAKNYMRRQIDSMQKKGGGV